MKTNVPELDVLKRYQNTFISKTKVSQNVSQTSAVHPVRALEHVLDIYDAFLFFHNFQTILLAGCTWRQDGNT